MDVNLDTQSLPDKADVVIVGGGLVGLSLGLALTRAGLACAVIDAEDPATAAADAFDGRAFALSASSMAMLDSLEVSRHLEAPPQPINDILVSDGRAGDRFRDGGPAPLFLHFDPREGAARARRGESAPAPLGFMVESRHLRRALYRAAAADGLCLRAPARVRGLAVERGRAVVALESGAPLTAALCVAADGKTSPLRRAAGIKTVGWSYRQHGIVTTVAHQHPHNGLAQEYFLSSGPFAILPLSGRRSSLVWTERSDLAPVLMALDEAAFTAQIRYRFGAYLGDVTPVGPRWSYPLRLQLALDYRAPRLALVGDAAHCIHPIAGQGLNLGLRDVAALAEVVVEAARLGLDIGADTVLTRYQRWRRFDTLALAAVTDSLNRLFGNDFAPLRLIRDLGLDLVGRIGPVRRFLMHHAGGTVGDLPRLLRGEAL